MFSVWIGSKVKDIGLDHFGCSRLGSRRTYARHLPFAFLTNRKPAPYGLEDGRIRPDGCSLFKLSKLIQLARVHFVRVYPRRIVCSINAYSMVSCRMMQRQVSELRSFPSAETCPFVYWNRQVGSNRVKPVTVTVFLHVVHSIDRHCRSRHAAEKHLITGEISSTDISFKLRQRDVLDFHVAALLIGDKVFRFELIECLSIALGACPQV